MPGLQTRSKRERYHKEIPGSQRFTVWFQRIKVGARATGKRPLKCILPGKVCVEFEYGTNVAWLTGEGELRLDDPDTGRIIS